MTASRYRVFTAIAALLVAAAWVLSIKGPPASPAVPSVGDYLVRIVRAMGMESRVGPRAPVDEYLPVGLEAGIAYVT